MTAWIGVDPGAKSTGILLRHENAPVRWTTVTQGDPPNCVADYLDAVIGGVFACMHRAVESALGQVLIAVEQVTAPNVWQGGQRRFMHPQPIIDTAMVFGAVVGRWPSAIVVPAAHNGQGFLDRYPPELVGLRETTGSGGKLRHVRSAWDVTLMGERMVAGRKVPA